MPGACRGAANQSHRRAVCRPPDAPLRPTRSWCPAHRRRRPGWRVQRPSGLSAHRSGGGDQFTHLPKNRFGWLGSKPRAGGTSASSDGLPVLSPPAHRGLPPQIEGDRRDHRYRRTRSTDTGALGRPHLRRNRSASIGSGNDPHRCASRNASVPPCGSTCPAIDSTWSNSSCAYPLAQRSPDQAVSPYSTIIQRSYSRSLPRTGTKRLPASRASRTIRRYRTGCIQSSTSVAGVTATISRHGSCKVRSSRSLEPPKYIEVASV